MQRLALLVAAAYATDSNYTTIVYTATGAQPNYDTFLPGFYNTRGLLTEVSQHHFYEPNEFTLWLGPLGTTTAEDLLNKTYDCDFRWDLEHKLTSQGGLSGVALTHACITVELKVGCDEGHALPEYCPTNRTTTGHTDLGAGAIVAIVIGVLIALIIVCLCFCNWYMGRTARLEPGERYRREASFDFEMPAVARY